MQIIKVAIIISTFLWTASVYGQVVSGGTYRIVSTCGAGDMVLQILNGSVADKAAVVLAGKYNASAQVFQITETSVVGYYKVVANHSKKAFHIDSGLTTNGAVLQQYTYSGVNQQLFKISNPGNGVYSFQAKHSGRYLDVKGAATAAGTAIQQFDANSSCAQKFKLEPSSLASSPFNGTAVSITSAAAVTIQAENFDRGGQNVAFKDLSASNKGGANVRTDSPDVDIEYSSDTGGGYAVDYIDGGEYLTYSIYLATAGSYTLSPRVASSYSGGSIHFELDGVDVTGSMAIPNTGSYQTYTNIKSKSIVLPAGNHRLRMVVNAGKVGLFNFNYFVVASTSFSLGQRPFAVNSSWNTRVSANASYVKLAWPAPKNGNYWVNWDAYSPAVIVGKSTDPLVNVKIPNTWGWPAQTIPMRIPIGVTGAVGTDGEILVMDGNNVHNCWKFDRTSDLTATCAAYGRSNLVTGSGWGSKSPFLAAGIVATGSSQLAGLLVQAETDRGEIEHALQIALDSPLVKPNPVGEAISSDGANPNGISQEGERLAIPRSAAMPVGLSPLGQKVFRAMQNYGVFNIDRAVGTTILRAQTNAYDGVTISNLRKDMPKLIPLLHRVQ